MPKRECLNIQSRASSQHSCWASSLDAYFLDLRITALQAISRYLRILWRAEVIIAQTRLRVMIRSCALYGLSVVVAAFGLGMLNVAGFVALEPRWGLMWAAITVALGDFTLALIILAVALTTRPPSELNSALDLRQAATEGLEAELGPLQERLAWLSRLARDPADAAFAGFLIPLVTAIIRALRKKDDAPHA
jgi:hypothetical protein